MSENTQPETWTFPQRLRVAASYLAEASRYDGIAEDAVGITEWSPNQLHQIADGIDADQNKRDLATDALAEELRRIAHSREWNRMPLGDTPASTAVASLLIAAGWRKP